MPFYEYECQSCRYYLEVLQKITDAPLRKCPSCGKQALTKLISAPVFRLKGSGWYETDFKSDKEDRRNLAAAEREEAKPSEAAKTEPASPVKPPESKPAESKPETKTPPAQVSSRSKPRPAPSTRRSAAAAGTRPSPRARGKPAPAKKGATKRRTKR